MAEKRFYWLKLHEDFFRQREIKKLRRIAGGDTYTIIYLKLLLLSLKDGGRLYYSGIEEDFAAEMALELDETEDNVLVTLNFLRGAGILQENNGQEFELLTVADMTGSETSGARRVRAHRERKALQSNESPLQSNGGVTSCNVEKEQEQEQETRDREEKSKADKPPRAPRFTPPTVEEVRAYCQEAGCTLVNPDRFVDFYEANGWVQGKGKPIKNWKASVRTWQQKAKEEQANKAVTTGGRVYTAADYLEGW